MADFRYGTSAVTLCPGYVGENIGSSGPSGEANVGTHRWITNHWFQNKGTNAQTQNVNIQVLHEVTVSYDKNNLMNVHSRTTVQSMTATGSANTWWTRHIVFRPYDGGPQGPSFDYSDHANGTILANAVIGEWDSGKIWPGNTTSTNDFYFCSWTVGYGSEAGCSIYIDKITAGMHFTNLRPIIYDSPSIKSTQCAGDSTGLKLTATVDFGAIRPGRNNTVYYEVSKDPDFKNIAWSGSKTGNNDQNQTLTLNMAGLQPNAKYYVRYRAYNGDKYSGYTTCEAVTLVTNRLSDPKSGYWNEGNVTLSIQMGDNYYTDPTTKIRIRKCGTSEWREVMTRTTKTVAHLTLTGLEAETCYEVQACTTTPAGTYCGNIVSFTTPKKNVATADFTQIDPKVDSDTQETYSDMCYHYKTDSVPACYTVYYRVKGGFDPTWIKAEEEPHCVDDYEGDYCFTIHDLFPNQTVYETYIQSETDGNTWDGPISEFTTPLLPLPENCNCDNFNYLVDLICQAVKPLYKGNKTIYANQTTKDLCDPYSQNPTLATLWSRILRFDHAAACLMCEMLDLIKLKNGNYDQYYVADTGWTTMAREVVDESELLVTSGTVAEYIAKKMHEVWHFHGTVDYIVGKLDEAPTEGVAKDAKLIVTEESQGYKWDGEAWVKDEDFFVDNFAIYHVNEHTETSFGIVEAGQAYYYFDGTWNNLDADTTLLDYRCRMLEQAKIIFRQDEAEDKFSIQTNLEDFNYDGLPQDERVICYVVEDTDKPVPPTYTITYKTDMLSTQVAPETVVAGAMAQRPANPVKKGFNFGRWEDSENLGVAFDFSTPIYKDYTLVANWGTVIVNVSYDIREDLGAVGETPETVQVNYGDPLPLPEATNFSIPGGKFVGWLRDGILMTKNDVALGDTVLEASYEMDKVTITLHPENGQPDIVNVVDYGSAIVAPTDPIKQDYIFIGWYTKEEGGELVDDWSIHFTANAEYWARYVKSKYVVTFKPGGGNEDFTQEVNYQETATEPETPIWKGGE